MSTLGQTLKMSFTAFMIALAVVAPTLPAHADPGAGGNSGGDEPIEFQVPDAIVEEHKNRLDIRIGNTEYIIQDPQGEERAAYDQLTREEQEKFDNNRRLQLGRLARVLQAMKYGFGVGSLVGNSLKYVYQKSFNAAKRVGAYPFTPDDHELYRAEERARQTMRERSEKIVTNMLTSVDRSFWSQAPLFAHSNEFGVMASLGVEALAGVEREGKHNLSFGGLFDIGVSIGFNRDNRAVVIQIFRDFETFKSTKMKGIFIAGALVKSGMYVANQGQERGEGLKRKGTSFYPPMVPGYSSQTPNSFSTGFSTGLTVPPSPIGDVLTYTNNLEQTTMLRISISPLLRGYVRVETGVGQAARSALKFIMEPISRAVQMTRGISVISCQQIFSL